MLEITSDDIANLNDKSLRALIGHLCEAEAGKLGVSASAVTWGGSQDAPDGGIDVRVTFPTGTVSNGFIPRADVGFQIKKPDMGPAAIFAEMRPSGTLRPSIEELIQRAGAYIIASSGADVSDTMLTARRNKMAEALNGSAGADALANRRCPLQIGWRN